MDEGLDGIEDLEAYMTRYGSLLAAQTMEAIDPLHVEGRDPIDRRLGALRRPLFEPQAHVATAIVKLLRRDRSANLVAEMGTGKTAMSIGAAHALLNANPYRALVMAPDHLLDKWAREIRALLPDADVRIVRDWREWLRLRDTERRERITFLGPPEGTSRKPGWAWQVAERATWFIVGRDRTKFDPAWIPAARWVEKTVEIDVEDEEGYVRKSTRRYKVPTCPKCGGTIRGRGGEPMSRAELERSKRTCNNEVVIDSDPASRSFGRRFPIGPGGPAESRTVECGEPLWTFAADRTKADRAKRQREADAEWARRCEKLIAEGREVPKKKPRLDNRPWRWAPARTIHGMLKNLFDVFILDEAHEEKSATSAQGNASGKIIVSCRKRILLTGTLVGGYAWHTMHTLFRTNPRALVDDGFEWGQELSYSERYGRVEEVVTTTGANIRKGPDNRYSMGSGAKTERRKSIKPGIMAPLYGNHLLRSTVFLGLEEVSSALPPRPADEVYKASMTGEVARAYAELEDRIRAFIAPMIVRGDKSLLSRMLQFLLAYPDQPWGWNEDRYLEPFGIADVPDFPKDAVYPKERELIDLVTAEKARGRQCWIYAIMTQKRDVAGRLQGLLRDHGLRCDVLRSEVDRTEREQWILDRGADLDVAISHPRLVETGLDLFDKRPGGCNFATIGFYQPGYNLFTLRQAGHRSWRIGQPRRCRLWYQYYGESMQERALALMGRKLVAAETIDGKFSAEGLAAMSGDEAAEVALAKSLSERIESAERAWARYTPTADPAFLEDEAGEPLPLPNRYEPAPADIGPMPATATVVTIADLAMADAIRRRSGRRRKDDPGQLLMFT